MSLLLALALCFVGARATLEDVLFVTVNGSYLGLIDPAEPSNSRIIGSFGSDAIVNGIAFNRETRKLAVAVGAALTIRPYVLATSDPCASNGVLRNAIEYDSTVRAVALDFNEQNELFGIDYVTNLERVAHQASSLLGGGTRYAAHLRRLLPANGITEQRIDPFLTLVMDMAFYPGSDLELHVLQNNSLHFFDASSGRRIQGPLPILGLGDSAPEMMAIAYTSTSKLYMIDFVSRDTKLFECTVNLASVDCNAQALLSDEFFNVHAATAVRRVEVGRCLYDVLGVSEADLAAADAAATEKAKNASKSGPAADKVAGDNSLMIYVGVGVAGAVLIAVLLIACISGGACRGEKYDASRGATANVSEISMQPATNTLGSTGTSADTPYSGGSGTVYSFQADPAQSAAGQNVNPTFV